MNFKVIISYFASFLLGMAVMLAISLYLMSYKVVDDITQALHISVYNYEMAIEQENRQNIIDRLNAQISCALDGVALVNNDKSRVNVDKRYDQLISKAKNLSYLGCEHPMTESSVVRR